MVGQLDHLVSVICGFMNDGQVEKPERKTEKKKCLFKQLKKRDRRKQFQQRTKPEHWSVSQHRTFAGLFPPLVV